MVLEYGAPSGKALVPEQSIFPGQFAWSEIALLIGQDEQYDEVLGSVSISGFVFAMTSISLFV
jgi:hypothetical protein